MNWNWDNLRFFLALAEHSTLSDAARQLGVSHSTVHRRINAFEEDLQTQLFMRTDHSFELTATGQSLYREAANVQSTLQSISRKIAPDNELVEGDVTITSTDTISYQLLPSIVSELAVLYPKLHISLIAFNRLGDIENLEADVAVRTGKQPAENLIGRKVGSLRFAVCASNQYCDRHGLHAVESDMANQHLILLDERYSSQSFYLYMQAHIATAKSFVTASDFLTAYRLCKAGAGLTILPTYLLRSDADLVEFEMASRLENDLWILSPSRLRDTERVKVVRQFLFDRLGKVEGIGINAGPATATGS